MVVSQLVGMLSLEDHVCICAYIHMSEQAVCMCVS